ncbi:MAG: hypothetical protein ACYDAD_07785 [Acidimicrobiales bacterium]
MHEDGNDDALLTLPRPDWNRIGPARLTDHTDTDDTVTDTGTDTDGEEVVR